jgi:predicted benzoate:H+ symporter BenE
MTMLDGTWVTDHRGDGRAVKVSAHVEAGFLVVSTWKAGTCVGTVRLLPAEAAELIAGLSESLAHLATAAHPSAAED